MLDLHQNQTDEPGFLGQVAFVLGALELGAIPLETPDLLSKQSSRANRVIGSDKTTSHGDDNDH